MKSDIKRLRLLRESLISKREHKIFLLEEGCPTEQEANILVSEINELANRIDSIDEKLPKNFT